MQTNDIVSKFFIGQYYQTLCQNYKDMSKFYASDCSLSFSIDKDCTKKANSPDKVVALFEECGLQESVVNLDNGHMNYVATEKGGMIILVSGQMSLADQKERQFSQAFMLVKLGECYAIKCDMLQLMELPELYVEQEVEVFEEVPPVQESAPKVEEFIPSFPHNEEPTPIEEPTPVEEAPVEESPVEESPVEEAPIEETPVVPEPVEEMSAPEPAEEPAVEEAPVEEAPAEEAPVEETPVEETPVEEAPVEPAAEKPAEAAVAPKEVEPAAVVVEKVEVPKKERVRNYNSRHNNHRTNRAVKKEEKADDDFVVIKSNYTKKATTRGSSLFVKYDNKSINKEALLNLFKNEGTVVNVYTNDRLFAFIDFCEKDAAMNAVKKAKEEPFRLGNTTLSVQINRSKNERVNRTRPAPKRE